MYYEETIIDGVLHYRTLPYEDFKPMGSEQLTNKILEMRRLYGQQIHIPSSDIFCNKDMD